MNEIYVRTGFCFSSRRRHTRFKCDWSQTCALPIYLGQEAERFDARADPQVRVEALRFLAQMGWVRTGVPAELVDRAKRSEERRVGKECGMRCEGRRVQ